MRDVVNSSFCGRYKVCTAPSDLQTRLGGIDLASDDILKEKAERGLPFFPAYTTTKKIGQCKVPGVQKFKVYSEIDMCDIPRTITIISYTVS